VKTNQSKQSEEGCTFEFFFFTDVVQITYV